MKVDEVWKSIEDFDGYEVSNLGRVRSNRHSWNGAYKILASDYHVGGYRRVQLMKDGKGYTFYVHQLVLKMFVGSPSEDDNIGHHKDGNPPNNRFDNLEWSNQSKNMLISSKTCGEYHGRTKLKENDIRAIRKLASEGVLNNIIAKHFKVTTSSIWIIVNRRTWKHI